MGSPNVNTNTNTNTGHSVWWRKATDGTGKAVLSQASGGDIILSSKYLFSFLLLMLQAALIVM